MLITVHTYPPALDVNQPWLDMLAGTQLIQPTSLSQPYIPKLDVFEGGCACVHRIRAMWLAPVDPHVHTLGSLVEALEGRVRCSRHSPSFSK